MQFLLMFLFMNLLHYELMIDDISFLHVGDEFIRMWAKRFDVKNINALT